MLTCTQALMQKTSLEKAQPVPQKTRALLQADRKHRGR